MSDFTLIPGCVTAPQGFLAAGVHCGIRKNLKKLDLALVVSTVPAVAACTTTQNKVCAAPVTVTRQHLENHTARAILCNSGNANAVNPDGMEKANAMCALVADALGIAASDVAVASTGVIGQPLDLIPIAAGVPMLAAALSIEGEMDAAHAIMTTDLAAKFCAVSLEIGGQTVKIGGIAKGSGMIHPNMATMLAFVTTDAAIAADALQNALSAATEASFNMITVDGDTSTNDMCVVLANGLAKNPEITTGCPDFAAFQFALTAVCQHLAKAMAKDGEGASKLLTANVLGAPTVATARAIAKSVVGSSLVKAAFFGEDANWGRILCAIGYAEGDFSVDKIAVTLSSKTGSVAVCANGAGVPFSEEKAKLVLSEKEIDIDIDLGQGNANATAWGCDLTYDYVKINGDYRS